MRNGLGIFVRGSKTELMVGAVLGKSYTYIIVDFCAPVESDNTCSVVVKNIYFNLSLIVIDLLFYFKLISI